ncbi:RING-type E3 ubiquitin transferase [Hordeum vulgare]|nr:RING-type E3 ubiquitin transferase [Hordeum vulgare]
MHLCIMQPCRKRERRETSDDRRRRRTRLAFPVGDGAARACGATADRGPDEPPGALLQAPLGALQEGLRALAESLRGVLRSSNLQSRAQAMRLVRSLADVSVPTWVIGLNQELLAEVIRVVHDRVSTRATKAALHALSVLCPYGRNRVKIVDAGAVPTLVELLLDEPERRVCELALAVLDRLCTCAEGRAKLVAHAAGVAVVGKKVLRVSEAASEQAVHVLRSVARHAATPASVASCSATTSCCKPDGRRRGSAATASRSARRRTSSSSADRTGCIMHKCMCGV